MGKLPTKSNNIGGQGGKRPGAGRKPKGVAEKAANGNPGGRKLTVLDIPDMEGTDMPKPDEILSATQKDGTKLKAAEIYEAVWHWLEKLNATAYVSPQVIEQYAMPSSYSMFTLSPMWKPSSSSHLPSTLILGTVV